MSPRRTPASRARDRPSGPVRAVPEPSVQLDRRATDVLHVPVVRPGADHDATLWIRSASRERVPLEQVPTLQCGVSAVRRVLEDQGQQSAMADPPDLVQSGQQACGGRPTRLQHPRRRPPRCPPTRRGMPPGARRSRSAPGVAPSWPALRRRTWWTGAPAGRRHDGRGRRRARCGVRRTREGRGRGGRIDRRGRPATRRGLPPRLAGATSTARCGRRTRRARSAPTRVDADGVRCRSPSRRRPGPASAR